MRQDKGIRKYENCILALLFIAANVVLMAICYDFYYDLNDDTMMHDIMAGIYSGTPDGHNMQTLYPLGALIALCYRVCRTIPWYGVFLCLCQFGSFYLVGVRLCALCGGRSGCMGHKSGKDSAFAAEAIGSVGARDRNIWFKCAVLFSLSLYLWGVCLPHLINIQYTITCAMLSAAAIFLFLTTSAGISTRQFIIQNIPSVILVVTAYQLRSEMLLLTFPLICLAGLYRLMEEQKIFQKENLYKYGGVLGMIFIGLLLSLLADKAAYGRAQWEDFRDFFDARTTVYDFYPELITDDAYSEALAELGVAPYQQTLLRNYNFGLDETIDTALMTKLADYAVHTIGANKDWMGIFREKLRFYCYRTLHSGDAPYNVMVLWAYAAVFLAGVLGARRTRTAKAGTMQRGDSAGTGAAEKNGCVAYVRTVGQGMLRRYAFIWQLALLIVGRSALWMFILVRGRDPERITHSLYIAEFALLMGMLVLRLRAGSGSADSETCCGAVIGKDKRGDDIGSAKQEECDDLRNGKGTVRVNKMAGQWMAQDMAILGVVLLIAALTGSILEVREDQTRREQVNQDREAIDAYCREHEGNFYFEDVYSTVAFSRRLFEASDHSYANYDIMGGWMCKSPLYREKLRRSGIEAAGEAMCTQDYVYLIMSADEQAERGLEWITAYYAAHDIVVTVEPADVIGDAGAYHVYQVRIKDSVRED